MKENLLNLIIRYKLNREEAIAWRLSILYMELVRKYFPEYKQIRMTAGDPRKKEVWKYFRKMLKDTEGKLKPSDYRFYMQAQLAILKNVRRAEGEQPYIHPNRFVGERAWARWCVWKKYFDNIKTATEQVKSESDFTKEATTELSQTHYALLVRLGDISKKTIVEAMESKFLFRLAALNVISPYFVVSSPTVRQFVTDHKIDLKSFGIDKKLYDSRLNRDIISFYRKLFKEI